MPTVAKLLLLANGASMFFIIVYMHLFRGLYWGSYIEPREYIWSSGVIILLLMMGTAFTGYVLPWGQMSFSGATVITSMLSILPKGQIIVEWLWGGKFQNPWNPWNLLQQLVSFSTTHPQYSYFYLEHCGLLECTNHKGDGALDVPQWSSHPVSDGAQCPAKSLVGAVDRLLVEPGSVSSHDGPSESLCGTAHGGSHNRLASRQTSLSQTLPPLSSGFLFRVVV